MKSVDAARHPVINCSLFEGSFSEATKGTASGSSVDSNMKLEQKHVRRPARMVQLYLDLGQVCAMLKHLYAQIVFGGIYLIDSDTVRWCKIIWW